MRWPCEARLATVPWGALPAVAPELDGPLGEVLAGRAAESVLAAFLRARPVLTRPERAAAAEALFGVGLWRVRLAWHAGADDPRAVPARRLLGHLLRDVAEEDGAEALCGLEPGALAAPRGTPQDLATRFSLPGWLAATLVREAPPGEAERLADALGTPGPIFLRANLALATRAAVVDRLAAAGVEARPGRWSESCVEVTSARPNLYALDAWREGLFEPQDEGSQLLADAVGARAGDAVLDLCAGAGGKTLALAARVGAEGSVHACDVDGERLDRLGARARRAGVEARVRVHRAGAEALPEALAVDRALVDAPCSELGPLRRGPDARFRLHPRRFEALPPLQLALCERAARHVRPGGRLVYATCTLRREENDEVADAFERRHPDWRRVPCLAGSAAALQEESGRLRTWPHRHGTDAFFAAAWERGGAAQ